MKNAPTEEKKKEEKGLERESFTRESLSKFRRISRDAAVLFTDCWPDERERGGPRNSIGRGSSTTDNKMITREYTGNYRNDNDEENDDNNGDSVDEGEGGWW